MGISPTLSGRTILVTGGGRRLGRAIVEGLSAAGARVVVHAFRSRDSTIDVTADLRRSDGASSLFAQLDRMGIEVDGVVHAAASFLARPILETTAEEWDDVQALNARAFFLLAREFARRLRDERSGDMIAIGDAAATELWTGYLAHSVAKATLHALVLGLAKALAPRIRVNAVAPGPVLPPEETPPEELAKMAERTLLKRLGTPAAVVDAVVFLLSNDYVTGTILPVDGGVRLWRGVAPATSAAAIPLETAGRAELKEEEKAKASRKRKKRPGA